MTIKKVVRQARTHPPLSEWLAKWSRRKPTLDNGVLRPDPQSFTLPQGQFA
jgi:hypothetical protein